MGHERLARVAGMDRHAEHEVRAVGSGYRVCDGRLRVEGDSRAETERARYRDRPGRIITGLGVEGHAVATGLRDRVEVSFGLGDHEMAVEPRSPTANEWRGRGQDDRTDRDVGDEGPVADVEVEDPRADVVKSFELYAEPREVGRVDRR